MRQLVKTSSLEVGEIKAFSISSIPNTYIACQGQAINRNTYSKLFAVLGTLYGIGDGVNTFNIPNYQGRFLRGLGGDSGVLGSYQEDLNVSHGHVQNSHNHTQNSHNHTQSSHGHTGSTNNDSHIHGGGSAVSSATFYTGSAYARLVAHSGTRHPYGDMATDSHGHTLSVVDATATNVANTGANTAAIVVNQNTGGTEARPKNLAMVYCIKY